MSGEGSHHYAFIVPDRSDEAPDHYQFIACVHSDGIGVTVFLGVEVPIPEPPGLPDMAAVMEAMPTAAVRAANGLLGTDDCRVLSAGEMGILEIVESETLQ